VKSEKDMSPSELLRWRELEGSGELAQSRRFRDASCRTCVFWDEFRCHRNSPHRNSPQGVREYWPTVEENDWCGSWERDYDEG
jgi:hypothetical protein